MENQSDCIKNNFIRYDYKEACNICNLIIIKFKMKTRAVYLPLSLYAKIMMRRE